MKSFARIACAVVVLASPVSAVVTARSVSSSGTPVERVVNLLKDLKEKLLTDEKVEQEVYDKYACWCEKTTQRKADAISDAQEDIRSLGQTILSLKGLIATRASEIAELDAAIKANKEAQAEATAIRSKENAEWVSETTELKEAIAALEKAVTVLVEGSKQPALLQASTAKAQIKAIILALPAKGVKPEQMALLSELMGSDAGYAPQSMTVQGILKDMYETFTADLESATQAEATSNMNFEKFIAEKTKEFKEDEAEKEKKEAETAESEQRLADTQNMYDATVAQKEADIKFFDETKVACQHKHDEWTTRSSLRDEEIEGMTKALEILTSDAARELFASAIKAGKETGMDSRDTGRDITPSLLQLDNEGSPSARAYAAMKSAAKDSRSFRLAALALEVRSAKAGHFEKVLMAIDNMIGMLKREDDADIAKHDQCKDEYQDIESTSKDLDWKIEKNEAKIDKLTKLIQLRTEQLAKTVEQINEVEAHMKAITKERNTENAAFLKAKEEDQQAIDLLMAARDAMAKFYKKNDIAMGPIQGSVKGVFAQQEPEFSVSADQAPDAVFSGKGERKGESKDIVSILTYIIEDLNDEIKNGMKGEEEAQVDFEAQMAAATQLHDDLLAKKVALESAIAKRNEERSLEIEDMDENHKLLQDEVNYKKSITPDCDWIIRAFEGRAKARASEMSGLVGAKEFLVGTSSLIETSKTATFDDSALSKVRFLGLRR